MRLRVYLDFRRTLNFMVVFTLAGGSGVGNRLLFHEWRLFVSLTFREVVQLRVPALLWNWGLM